MQSLFTEIVVGVHGLVGRIEDIAKIEIAAAGEDRHRHHAAIEFVGCAGGRPDDATGMGRVYRLGEDGLTEDSVPVGAGVLVVGVDDEDVASGVFSGEIDAVNIALAVGIPQKQIPTAKLLLAIDHHYIPLVVPGFKWAYSAHSYAIGRVQSFCVCPLESPSLIHHEDILHVLRVVGRGNPGVVHLPPLLRPCARV